MISAKPILVTGASGKTGRRVIAELAARGAWVRAFIRRPAVADELTRSGAQEIAIGDLGDRESLVRALTGAGQVLHICPPLHPREDAIAKELIELAAGQGVDRFVLYSVMHPLLSNVPNHARKLEAERHLVNSGLTYTILQPIRYMQHLATVWPSVIRDGVHCMPFSTKAKISAVDLADLAEAAALVMTTPGHEAATYQLAGPHALSQEDMAAILTRILGRPIRAAARPFEEVRRDAEAAGLPAERIATMGMMSAHYDAHGLVGNPNVLRWILGREPTTYEAFVRREMPLS